MLSPETLAALKLRLLQQQHELLDYKKIGNEAAQIVELDQTKVGRLSRMDALQGQAMALERERRRELELREIAAALRRIDNDEYGYCLECGEAIAFKRLEFNPALSLCFDCASKADT